MHLPFRKLTDEERRMPTWNISDVVLYEPINLEGKDMEKLGVQHEQLKSELQSELNGLLANEVELRKLGSALPQKSQARVQAVKAKLDELEQPQE